MCINCWMEAGQPTDLPEDIDEIVGLIQELYSQPGGGVGGPLHIVTDDWNLKDGNVEFALRSAAEDPDWTAEIRDLSRRIAERFLSLSESQRAAVLARVWSYI
jgi:hypothetical protein